MNRHASRENLDVVTKHMQLPLLENSRIGAFIGPKGVNLKAIEQKYKVHLSFRQEKFLEINGPTTEAVNLAEISVEQHVMNLFSSGCSHKISIPTKMIGFFIGTKGKNINDIRIKSGVKIEIMGGRMERTGSASETSSKKQSCPDFVDENGIEFTDVRLYGDYANIRVALTMISSRLFEFGKENVHNDPRKEQFFENWTEVSVCN